MPTFAERANKWKERLAHPELPDPYDPPQIDRNNLVPNGVTFWQKLGQQNGRTNDVQIILYGCDSGQSYAPVVARIANCPVWGALYHCTPGVWTSDTKYNLEQMKSEREVPKKFKRFLS